MRNDMNKINKLLVSMTAGLLLSSISVGAFSQSKPTITVINNIDTSMLDKDFDGSASIWNLENSTDNLDMSKKKWSMVYSGGNPSNDSIYFAYEVNHGGIISNTYAIENASCDNLDLSHDTTIVMSLTTDGNVGPWSCKKTGPHPMGPCTACKVING
jgi:hypothetical protein